MSRVGEVIRSSSIHPHRPPLSGPVNSFHLTSRTPHVNSSLASVEESLPNAQLTSFRASTTRRIDPVCSPTLSCLSVDVDRGCLHRGVSPGSTRFTATPGVPPSAAAPARQFPWPFPRLSPGSQDTTTASTLTSDSDDARTPRLHGCWHVVTSACSAGTVKLGLWPEPSSRLEAVSTPKALFPHTAWLGSVHCKFPTAASRRSLGRVWSSVADHTSRDHSIVALVGPAD